MSATLFCQKKVKEKPQQPEEPPATREENRPSRRSHPPRADLPRCRDDARRHQSGDDRGDRDRQRKGCSCSPSDRGEGFGKGREPRRCLAAAELATFRLDAEPELDRGGGGGRDD